MSWNLYDPMEKFFKHSDPKKDLKSGPDYNYLAWSANMDGQLQSPYCQQLQPLTLIQRSHQKPWQQPLILQGGKTNSKEAEGDSTRVHASRTIQELASQPE